MTSTSPAIEPASSWRTPLVGVLLLALATTPVFWLTDLDIRVSALFYSADTPMDRWPREFLPVWRFFYYGAPLFVGALALGASLLLVVGLARRSLRRWRRPAAYILLTLVLGPGLLINVVFKDNWGRPRPRQIEQFDGQLQYLPPLAMAESDEGRSFPAGHASVGFAFFTLWFLWRGRWPRMALLAFVAATALGVMMGLGRMAAGGHFLSDVLWSGYLTFLTALVLYQLIGREPARTAGETADEVPEHAFNLPAVVGYTLAGCGVALGALMNYPIDEQVDFRPGPAGLPSPTRLFLDLGLADVTLRLGHHPEHPLQITGTVRGFGLPIYEVKSDGLRYNDAQDPNLVYIFNQQGYFIEMDARLVVDVDVSRVQELSVYLRHGDIRISGVPGVDWPRLRVQALDGEVFGLPPGEPQVAPAGAE